MAPKMPSQAAIAKAVADYQRDGYAVIEDFLSPEEIEAIKKETVRIVEQESSKENVHEIWDGDHVKKTKYVDGGDKVTLWYEKYAVDKATNKVIIQPIQNALCKLGFALHRYNKFFKDFITQDKVSTVLRALGYEDPHVIQTMVNFKNPRVGGEFIPHQDTSYLTTDDPNHVVGFWFALDDATVDNGCVQFIPGSHKWELVRKFVRQPADREDGVLIDWTGPMAIYDEKTYKNATAKKGSLVLIHGKVLHKSENNKTDNSRWAFAFHCFDQKKCNYVDKGWLPKDCKNFEPLYTVSQ